MNKTNPDKEKLKEEFGKVIFFTPEFEKLTATQAKNIADWWLDKMEAQKADTIAIIEGIKMHCFHNEPSRTCDTCGWDSALDQILSILRKER